MEYKWCKQRDIFICDKFAGRSKKREGKRGKMSADFGIRIAEWGMQDIKKG